MESIDVVIPLGNGSVYDDLELKYALRSVQQFLIGYRRVYIIGELPIWCHNVVHIPWPDKSKYKQRNICGKVIRACDEASVSDEFLFMNDDHYFTRVTDARTFPYYAHGTIESEIKRGVGEYKRALVNTLSALKDLSTWNFDVHYPIRYRKDHFLNLMTNHYDWNVPDGYVIKSLYCNSLNIKPDVIQDCKVHDYLPQPMIEEIAASRPCLSTSNYAITNPMRRVLDKLYPEKSVYER